MKKQKKGIRKMKVKAESLVGVHTLCLVNKIKLNIRESRSYSVSFFDTS